jgi:hypothetical protein
MITKKQRQNTSKRMNLLMKKIKEIKKWNKTKVREVKNEKKIKTKTM